MKLARHPSMPSEIMKSQYRTTYGNASVSLPKQKQELVVKPSRFIGNKPSLNLHLLVLLLTLVFHIEEPVVVVQVWMLNLQQGPSISPLNLCTELAFFSDLYHKGQSLALLCKSQFSGKNWVAI